MGDRGNAADLDFSEILSEEVEEELKEASVISMGTEISDPDLVQIKSPCDEVIAYSETSAQVYDYLRRRMNMVAPNLTSLVEELVGARLIAHAGSLLSPANQSGSTVQILGAEKAPPKLMGKISRSLAAKTVLAIRYDALGEGQDGNMGIELRAKLETRLRVLEGKELGRSAGMIKGKPKIKFYDKDRKKGVGAMITAAKTYNPSADLVLGTSEELVTKKQAGEEDGVLSRNRKHEPVDVKAESSVKDIWSNLP